MAFQSLKGKICCQKLGAEEAAVGEERFSVEGVKPLEPDVVRTLFPGEKASPRLQGCVKPPREETLGDCYLPH